MIKRERFNIARHEEILNFIRQFQDLGATNCFSNGMCYWFAVILKERFEDGLIVYNQIDNHFAVLLYDTFRVYDITGDVSDKCEWEDFEFLSYADELLYNRLLRDCVYKLPFRE